MDGIHDLGGFQGFGLVEMEADEPLFHADWERRIFRLMMGAMLSGHLGVGCVTRSSESSLRCTCHRRTTSVGL
jgi:nitrile hydratase